MASRFALVLFSVLFSCSLFGQEKTDGFRAYDLAQHGVLQLTVPVNWNDQLRRGGHGLPSIDLTPAHGNSFDIHIVPQFEASAPGTEAIKSRVTAAAEGTQGRIVEKTVRIQEFQGTSGAGYYFSVTDRAPKRDEFKSMTQGTLGIGELLVDFTILTNDGAESAAATALKILGEARLAKPASR